MDGVATTLENKHLNFLSKRRCRVDIEFRNLAYGVPIGGSCCSKPTITPVLRGVSGTFRHGKVNAIMGPSGSGKSSLLNALFGFNSIVEGQMIINGVEYQAKEILQVMRSISSYIMQDDCLVGELTVKESLHYAAQFKYGDDLERYGRGKIRKIIQRVLDAIGMTESANVRVAQCSGGQRKRVAVAVELLNYKPVLFLDECTTGLDSTSCYKLVRLLRNMATNGCNIIATIHQPNSLVYRLFDWLYVLAPGGIKAFEGHPTAVTAALEVSGVFCHKSENPADVLFETNKLTDTIYFDSNIKKLSRAWHGGKLNPANYQKEIHMEDYYPTNFVSLSRLEGDSYCPRSQTEDASYRKVTCPFLSGDELINYCQQSRQISTWYQFKTHLKRSIIQTKRNAIASLARYIAMIYFSLLVGGLFLLTGNEASLAYSNVVIIYLLSIVAMSGPSFFIVIHVSDILEILTREHYINEWYGLGTYFVVSSLIELFMGATCTMIYAPIIWLMTAQPHAQASLPAAMIILTILSCTSYYLVFSVALFGDPQGNLQWPFAISTLQTMFGGFLIPLVMLDPWFRWLGYANFGTWAYIGLMKSIYTPWDDYFVEIDCKSGNDLRCGMWKTGPQVLQWLHIDTKSTPLLEIGILLLFLVVLFSQAWFLLSLRLKQVNRYIARI